MKKSLSKSLPLLIILLVVFATDCLLPVHSSALIGIKEGDIPKEIILDDLDGETIDVSSHFGNGPVIIVFWKLTNNKVFLNYSLDELLFLNDFHKKHHEKSGLKIFAIYVPREFNNISDSEISSVRNLVESNGIKFPVLIDREFKLFKSYGVIALPSTVMLGKTGEIDFIYSSFPLAARPVIADKINELIGIADVAHKQKKVKKKRADSRSDRFYNYALQMYKKGLLEQSLSALQKSIALKPDNSWAHNLMGIILWGKGIYDESMDEFIIAIELDRNNVSAHINYTVLLIARKDYEEAERILITLPAAEFKLKIRAHHLLGIVYERTNRLDKAIEEFETATGLLADNSHETNELSPDYYSLKTSIFHGLSVLYIMKGDNEKGLDMLHKAFHEALGLGSSSSIEHLVQRNDLMIYE